ncbi:MAG: hypothetical protein KDA24_15850, partial [Deltaproteobacteria bacterium]|nr:hypothetical protein [Deltaproteobacteria bacterium]
MGSQYNVDTTAIPESAMVLPIAPRFLNHGGGNQGNGRLISINPETGAGTAVGDLLDGGTGTYHSSTADRTFVGDRMIGWSETQRRLLLGQWNGHA